MKIVLAEERADGQRREREFDRASVKVGRDPAECQIVFDQTEWPMVSRRHAEFRLKDRRCLLVDTNSSFGTFLNEQRITEPVEIRSGARIQFGAGGPVLRVALIEEPDATESIPPVARGEMDTRRDLAEEATVSLNASHRASEHVSAAPSEANRQQQQPPSSSTREEVAAIEIISSGTGTPERRQLKGDVTRLGRDPEMDVVIDAAAAVVSRRHAEIRRQQGQCVLFDMGSFNGTLLNEQRIAQPVALYHGDLIQLGMGGPTLRFIDPTHPAPNREAQASGPRPLPTGSARAAAPASLPAALVPPSPVQQIAGDVRSGTIAVKGNSNPLNQALPGAGGTQPQLLLHLQFDARGQLTIGRASDNDIQLDGLQISNHHARLLNTGAGVLIEDVNSTNGVYVNGERISGRKTIQGQDTVQIGPFVLHANSQYGVAVYDTRSKTRIDAIDITKIVPNRSGKGSIKLLDDVDLTIQPNEFVGLLGPSGAGKSTLMDSLNGMRPATSGKVLINNLDLYQHLDSIKQSIGYVPQDDIIHRELTVYRTLYYVARLRLSRDVSTREIDQIVGEVLDVTGLSERRDVAVGQLSGGQRKRVSIAVELITKPSVIFLDEPTSGLDPATEEKIMRLFRQIAESGRTVILTTHAMENVKLFDKIVVMMRGKLVFYGTPQEALAHVQAESFKDLYDKLEAPIEERINKLTSLPLDATREQKQNYKLQRERISEEVAEDWKQGFRQTEQYQRHILHPLSGLKRDASAAPVTRRRPTVTDALRQWGTLARRYTEVLTRDKFNLLILFGQAPIIALLTYLVVGALSPRDFPYFMLALVAIWFGTSVSAREIIRERAVYNRERMVNLGLLPYVGSKLFVLSLVVGLQCILLFGTLKFFDLVGLMKLPGYLFGIPQLLVMILTGLVGIALGLFISAVVKTSEMATSLVPLILIPQILFSGLVGVPAGAAKVIGTVMPATWAFDEMKRLSTLDTLREEGSNTDGPNRGRGLYKHVEDVNDLNIKRARADIEKYKTDAEGNSKDFERQIDEYVSNLKTGQAATQPTAPELGPAPEVPGAIKVNEDLSDYVDFLHPWGHVLLNPLMLMLMFCGLITAIVLALRSQDIG